MSMQAGRSPSSARGSSPMRAFGLPLRSKAALEPPAFDLELPSPPPPLRDGVTEVHYSRWVVEESNKAVGDAEPVEEGAAQTLTDEARSQDSTQGRSTHTGPGTTATKMDALFEEGRVKGAAADKVFARTCGGVGDEAPPPLRARHSLRGRLSLDLDGHRPLCPHACSISAADGALSRGSRRPRRNSATVKRRAASRARRARRQLRGKGLRGRRRR